MRRPVRNGGLAPLGDDTDRATVHDWVERDKRVIGDDPDVAQATVTWT